MNREKRLVKNTIIYLIGNFGSKFLGFIILPLYTHYLNKNQYGYFDLVNTYITLLMPFITLQITDAQYRYLLDSNDNKDKSIIITTSCSIILWNLIIGNIILITLFQFFNYKYQYLFLIQLDVSIIYSIWVQIARGQKQNFLYSISGLIFTVISLLSNIITIMFLNYGIKGLILSNIIATAITIIFIEYKLRIYSYINFKLISKKLRLKFIKFSLPLMPNVVSWWVMNVSDRSLLNHYLGMDANGIYAIANKFPSIILMLNSIFSLAWQESMITESKSKDNNEFYSRMFNLYVIIQFTGTIVFLAITKPLIRILVDNSYYDAWKYVPFLYLATIFSGFSSFYGASYLSSEKTIGSFFTSMIGAIINVIVNIGLIPIIGIQGASLSTMISFLVMWVARIVNTKKYINIKINIRTLFPLLVITSIYIYFYYFNNVTLEVILFVLSICIFILYNKNLLIIGKKFIKAKMTFH